MGTSEVVKKHIRNMEKDSRLKTEQLCPSFATLMQLHCCCCCIAFDAFICHALHSNVVHGWPSLKNGGLDLCICALLSTAQRSASISSISPNYNSFSLDRSSHRIRLDN